MSKTEHIRKSHNVSLIMYHFVCPSKYRKIIFEEEIDIYLKEICLEIECRYEITFLEIWTDKDHVHFLIQWIPKMSPTEIITIIKSLTSREIFLKFPEVKKKLWWWNFWSSWFYVNTVWQHWNEDIIRKYVQNQWNENKYKQIYKWFINENQLTLL